MIDWTIFLSVFAALVAYSVIRGVVRWIRGRRQARSNRYTDLVNWWVDQRTAVLIKDGVSESDANEQAAYDLSRLRFQAHLSELFKNVWEFASIIFAVILLFSIYVFLITQDFDKVVQFLGRFVSERALAFVLLILAMAGLTTVLHWRYAVVAYLERLKDPTWTDSPKLVKWWTKVQRGFKNRYDRATGLHRYALTATILVIGLAYVVLSVGAILLAAWYFGFFPNSP